MGQGWIRFCGLRRNLVNSEVGRWVRNTFPTHHTLSEHLTSISPPRNKFSTDTFHPSVKSVWLSPLPDFPHVSEVKVTQSCPTLCDPMDYTLEFSRPDYWSVGSLSLLQGIFPTLELNPGLSHCRRILYQLSHQGGPSSHSL